MKTTSHRSAGTAAETAAAPAAAPRGRPAGRRGGRPSKFAEPGVPVTMRLPASTLERLALIDSDRARAVVRSVDAVLGRDSADRAPVRELLLSGGDALVVVPDSPLLRSVPWLRLVEISPGRNLISLRHRTSIERLELTLVDLLDAHPDASEADRRMVALLLERIRAPRRNHALEVEEILLVPAHSRAPGGRA